MKGYVGAPENLSKIIAKVCEIFNGELCSLGTFLAGMTSPTQLNETRVPVYAGHYPIGTTIQNLRHYYQVYKAKDFVMYDHGAKENQKRYGQEEAPAYPVERITTPWAIFASEDDTIADPRDVKDLIDRLGPRVIEKRVIPQKNFRHGDFQIGHKTKRLPSQRRHRYYQTANRRKSSRKRGD
nr:lipase 1-like [Rhipicephalus microplus]